MIKTAVTQPYYRSDSLCKWKKTVFHYEKGLTCSSNKKKINYPFYSLVIKSLDGRFVSSAGKCTHEQPQEYEDGTNRVCRVHVSLYDLKQVTR